MNKRDEVRREHEPRRHEGREHNESERPPKQHGTGYGRERAVYEAYLSRKWQGSVPPTAEAYARALALWRQLPGAVITEPTDLGKTKTAPSSHAGHTAATLADQTSGKERL